jgi:hypothetical protein
MKDLSKTVIYKIICKDTNITETYYGSTVNLDKREGEHFRNCNNPTHQQHNYKVYRFIREHGGFKNWIITKVKNYPCKTNLERRMEEQRHIDIDRKKCLNTYNAYQSKEDRRLYNRIKSQSVLKFSCPCGGVFTKYSKKIHNNSKRHQKHSIINKST